MSDFIGAYRAAAATPPVGAPREATARGVWAQVEPVLRGHGERIRLTDVATTLLPRLTAAERESAKLTAMKALAIAIDACVCAGRDRRNLYINTVFDALAKRWSRTFRDANATTSWNMKEDTVRIARRELLEAGVDLDRIWSAVRDGIADLYTTRQIGGPGHTRGRRVKLHRRSARFRNYDKLLRREREYRRPPERRRLLLADRPTPPLKIAKWTVAERDYDVMNVGEPTKAVIRILESTRLFLDVKQVRADAMELGAQVKAHPWRRMYRRWAKIAQRNLRDPDDFQAARKKFLREHQDTQKEYRSLVGRHQHAVGVYRQARRARKHIDAEGHLEIRTAYYKTRNRRFQPRHIWPTEASSKEDAEATLIAPAQETVLRGRWLELGSRAIYAKHSQRGRWFLTHASGLDIEHDDWEGWTDDFAGDRRPLVGVDARSSMYQIVAVALGWRDAEHLLRNEDFKDAIVRAMGTLAARGKYVLPIATDQQLRKGVGQIVNVSYGAAYGSILKTLRDDAAKFGTNWGTPETLQTLLVEGAKIDEAISIVVRMRDEYLQTARAVVEAAHQRDPFAGVSFCDPFDEEPARWHRPRTEPKVLSHGAVPLRINVPVGVDGDKIAADYFGTPRRRKGSIQNLIGPALIHALDAAYASHVILKLHDAGVRDIVMVNDCFLVPSDALPELDEALKTATEPWFRGLGPFYKVFEDYLGDDRVHGPIIDRWKRSWLARLAAADAGAPGWRPEFQFKTETTFSLLHGGPP